MRFQCPHCHAVLQSDEVSEGQEVECPACGREFACEEFHHRPKVTVADDPDEGVKASRLAAQARDLIVDSIGIEKLQGFSLKSLFSEVFGRHEKGEVENAFTVGVPSTTPDIGDVDASWPRPWLFMRMLFASVALYLLFLAGWEKTLNTNLLPGLILVGSFAIPISTLVFFFEINVRKNVSLYQIVKLFFLGGTLGILFSLGGFSGLEKLFGEDSFGAVVAGPVEETAKLLAVVGVARAVRYRYKLNGLLFGAAVGAGFAAFESAGYALSACLEGVIEASAQAAQAAQANAVERAAETFFSGFFQTMSHTKNLILMRGALSPFAHVVWSAIAGAALWRVKRGRPFAFGMLSQGRFLRLFLVPVVFHMVWNSHWELPFYGKYLILGALAWIVVLSLLQEGLREIREEQTKSRRGLPAPKTGAAPDPETVREPDADAAGSAAPTDQPPKTETEPNP